jgi:N-carbamoyl-L-amino-acid hydrolase
MPVLTGSHLDSQPSGGKFDGVFGVLAGLEAAQSIRAAGVTLRRPLEIVAWMNEEGARFVPGMMGSAAGA